MSSKAGSGEASTSSRGESDLLIVGPGVLGSLVGKLWHDQHASASVTGYTNTDTNHERSEPTIFPEVGCKGHCIAHG